MVPTEVLKESVESATDGKLDGMDPGTDEEMECSELSCKFPSLSPVKV